jgi:SAM-dependent methyltransferase
MNKEALLPRLNAFELPSKNSWNYIHYHTYFAALKKVMDRYITEGCRVFDVGCGNKPFERYVRTLVQNDAPEYYTGCDVVQSSEQKVDIICSATDIPASSSAFDVVLCTQVMEHVFDHNKIFAEAYRLLRPGGVFIASAPFVYEMHEKPYDFYRFTRYGFRNLMSGAGFEILEELANGGKWATAGQVLLEVVKEGKSRTLVKRALRRLAVRFCNRLFLFLDKKCADSEIYTLNYVFVGKKQEL